MTIAECRHYLLLAPIPKLTFPGNVSFPKGVVAPVIMNEERNVFMTVDKDKTAEADQADPAVLKEFNLVSSRCRQTAQAMLAGEDEFFAFVRANTDGKSGFNLDAAKTYARVVNPACVAPGFLRIPWSRQR